MASIGKSGSVAKQLANGASIVAAYKALESSETAAISVRFEAFAKEQASYEQAHQQVVSLVGEKKVATGSSAAMSISLDNAIDALGRTLIAAGHDLSRPLAAYTSYSIRQLAAMRLPAKVVAIRQVLSRLQSDKGLAPSTAPAVNGVQIALANAEASIARVTQLEASIVAAREACTTAAGRWSTAFDALKAGCESATYDGSPRLAGIFASTSRPRPKRTKDGARAATPTDEPGQNAGA